MRRMARKPLNNKGDQFPRFVGLTARPRYRSALENEMRLRS
jgi:hypothetical protein